MTVPAKITGVAIKINGDIYSLPKPARHSDLIRHLCEKTTIKSILGTRAAQGFVDENGEFLDRKSALQRAIAAGQITWHVPGVLLFSEDLW